MNESINFPALLNAANILMKQVSMTEEWQVMLTDAWFELAVIDSDTLRHEFHLAWVPTKSL